MSQTLYNFSLNDSNDEFLEKISEHTVWILFGLLGKINTIYSSIANDDDDDEYDKQDEEEEHMTVDDEEAV